MKYQHIQNGKIVVSAEQHPKFKTYRLTFEDGTVQDTSGSTFKRYYKEIPDDTTEEVKEETVEETTEPEVESNLVPMPGTEDPDWGKKHWGKEEEEAPKKEEPKAKETPKPKKKESKGITNAEAYKLIAEEVHKLGYESQNNELSKTVSILKDNKKFVGIYVGRDKCNLLLTKKMVPEGFKADKVRNCPMSHVFNIPYNNMEKLGKLLNAIKKEEN